MPHDSKSEVGNMGTVLVRAVFGALAGAVLGVITICAEGEAISCDPAEIGFGLLLVGIGAGGTVGILLGVVAGTWEIRGRAGGLVVGLLAGYVLGLFAAVLYPDLVDMVTRGSGGSKAYAHSIRAVFAIVPPAGSVLGGIMGFLVGGRRYRRGGR